MKKIIACLLLTVFFISCGNSQEVESISTVELKAVLAKEKVQLLDVRTPDEVKNGAIESAKFADFYADTFLVDAIKQLDKNKPVYLYCRSGNRSGKASKILQEKGYKAINVSGGYSQWNK